MPKNPKKSKKWTTDRAGIEEAARVVKMTLDDGMTRWNLKKDNAHELLFNCILSLEMMHKHIFKGQLKFLPFDIDFLLDLTAEVMIVMVIIPSFGKSVGDCSQFCRSRSRFLHDAQRIFCDLRKISILSAMCLLFKCTRKGRVIIIFGESIVICLKNLHDTVIG